MTRQGAERAIIISALAVFGIYMYRIVTEGQGTQTGGIKQLLGIGSPANVGRFVTGWGFAFLVIATIGEAAPGFGGAFAILVAMTDFLANAAQIGQDINKALTKKQQENPAGAGASASSGATGASPGYFGSVVGGLFPGSAKAPGPQIPASVVFGASPGEGFVSGPIATGPIEGQAEQPLSGVSNIGHIPGPLGGVH